MKIVDELLLDQFRAAGHCELCGKWSPTRDPHHLARRGMGGGGRLDVRINIIALCWLCHLRVHDGVIPRKEIIRLVAAREGISPEALVDEIHRLRRTSK